MITKDDIQNYAPCEVELPNGWTARVKVENDDSMGPPWEEHDGHGPVRSVHSGGSPKLAGERVLAHDGYNWTLYDFAEAVRTARRERWRTGKYPHCSARTSVSIGGKPNGPICGQEIDPLQGPWQHRSHAVVPSTARDEAALAAIADFERMHAWCNDEWRWIGVEVQLLDAEGKTVVGQSTWGIESDTDYWRDVAADLINELAAGVVMPNAIVAGVGS